ncbi:MAG: YeeE/YedE family protein [Pseudomonadota bacterium]
MLLELYDFGLEARTLHIAAGLLLGLVFGIAAQITRFCLRRAVAGDASERGAAGAVWLTALATAILAYVIASGAGFVTLDGHRFASSDVPVLGIVAGGLAFGIGMVLTRGCVSRLTVLSATGNLRAAVVLLVFAVVAHACMKGVLSPFVAGLSANTVSLPFASFHDLPLGGALLFLPVAVLAAVLAWRARPDVMHLVLGAVIGLVAVAGWATTSVLLFDEFEPLPVQTAAFTLPWTDTLFWIIASSAIPASFGVGFVGGALSGSFLSAAARGEVALQSFESPAQTARYVAGGALMGVGGVLAGGCTVGAGLSGVATGGVSAVLALAAIAVGGWAAANVAPSGRAVTAA